MRSTRNQPFCWQEKWVLRKLRKEHSGAELVKLRALYCALTEIDSDFNGKNIRWYTKTIATYTGLSRNWIPSGLRTLEALGIVAFEGTRDKAGKPMGHGAGGKFETGEIRLVSSDDPSVAPKPVNGESVDGDRAHQKNSSYSEDSSVKKDTLNGHRADFAEWYVVYPRHVGKKAAEKAYAKALQEASPAQLLAGAKRERAKGNPQKYTPHPATWLNQGRWEDDDEEAEPQDWHMECRCGWRSPGWYSGKMCPKCDAALERVAG